MLLIPKGSSTMLDNSQKNGILQNWIHFLGVITPRVAIKIQQVTVKDLSFGN